MTLQAKGNQQKSGIVILLSDKMDFKAKMITREKGHYTMTEVSIHQKDETIIYIYVPNI